MRARLREHVDHRAVRRAAVGQLGQGNTNQLGDNGNEMGQNLPIVDLGPGRTAKSIASFRQHNCAILDDDSVKCWGRNSYGQLGLGSTSHKGDGSNEMGSNLPAVDLGPGRTAKAVVAGYWHSCAWLDDGTVKCWGANSDGELGAGNVSGRGGSANQMGSNLPIVDLGN